MTSEWTQGQTPDVYGQVHPVETEDLKKKKLEELQIYLEHEILLDDKKEYMQAQAKCPELVDDTFHLQFLRCEVYNVDLAAKRLAKYWKKRVEIYGPEKAFQKLSVDNMMEDQGDKVALELGVMRLLPCKDPSGRSILYWDPSHLDSSKYPVESMIRAFWYVLHAAVEDTSAQQKGVLVIVDPQRAGYGQFDTSLSKLIGGALAGVLPLRMSGIHICYPPYFAQLVLPIVKLFMPERMQKRIRFHSGSQEEVITTLDSDFGLDPEMLPTLVGGKLTFDYQSWLKQRREEGI